MQIVLCCYANAKAILHHIKVAAKLAQQSKLLNLAFNLAKILIVFIVK